MTDSFKGAPRLIGQGASGFLNRLWFGLWEYTYSRFPARIVFLRIVKLVCVAGTIAAK
jgi:hypothetical protein